MVSCQRVGAGCVVVCVCVCVCVCVVCAGGCSRAAAALPPRSLYPPFSSPRTFTLASAPSCGRPVSSSTTMDMGLLPCFMGLPCRSRHSTSRFFSTPATHVLVSSGACGTQQKPVGVKAPACYEVALPLSMVLTSSPPTPQRSHWLPPSLYLRTWMMQLGRCTSCANTSTVYGAPATASPASCTSTVCLPTSEKGSAAA